MYYVSEYMSVRNARIIQKVQRKFSLIMNVYGLFFHFTCQFSLQYTSIHLLLCLRFRHGIIIITCDIVHFAIVTVRRRKYSAKYFSFYLHFFSPWEHPRPLHRPCLLRACRDNARCNKIASGNCCIRNILNCLIR